MQYKTALYDVTGKYLYDIIVDTEKVKEGKRMVKAIENFESGKISYKELDDILEGRSR